MPYSYTIAAYISGNFRVEGRDGCLPEGGLIRSVCDRRPDGDRLPCPNAHKHKDNDVCRKCDVRVGLPSDLTQAQINEMCAKSVFTNKIPYSGRKEYYSPNKGMMGTSKPSEPCKCILPWCSNQAVVGDKCSLCYRLVWNRKTAGLTGDDLYVKPKRVHKARRILTDGE